MELQYYGANCIRITTRKTSIVIDDNLGSLGLKSVTKPGDIVIRTSGDMPKHKDVRFSAESPGEYEIAGVIIHGIGARAHMDEEGKTGAVVYTIEAEDVRIAVVGHIFPDLSDEQVEQIGHVDVAIIPVGGNGYILDGTGALQVIKKLEPRLVIPTHYADKAIKYEVPQAELVDALKSLTMEPQDTVVKLKLKQSELSEGTHLIVLERQ